MKFILNILLLHFLFMQSVAYSQNKNEKTAIIYEYNSFTQKKGESLDNAMSNINLSSLQKSFIKNIPVASINKKRHRVFRIALANGILKEANISYENSEINFILLTKKGKKAFVKGKTRIQPNQVKETKVIPNKKVTYKNKKSKPTVEPSKSATIKQVYFIQHKGQSLSKAIKVANLSSLQKQLILNLAITKSAISDRQFHLRFEGSKTKPMLRGVKVVRGNNFAEFIIKVDSKGIRTVPSASGISTKKSILLKGKSIPRNNSIKSNILQKDKALLTEIPLNQSSFTQQKGQSLASALRDSGIYLTNYQKKIFLDVPIIPQAKSNRKFFLLFSGTGKNKLLKEVKVRRGKNSAEFTVKKINARHKLVSLKKYNQPKSTKRKKDKKKNNITKKSSDKYTSLTFKQKKRQSIGAAASKIKLSNIQKKLIKAIPVTARAKSTRTFKLLFGKSGKAKYLKAVKVSRAGRNASFVLVKYKNQFKWANRRGEIKTNSNGSKPSSKFPIRNYRISSRFNLRRRHPITRRIRPHKGIDLSARRGTPVYAPAGGAVKFAGRQRGYGKIIEINHGNGYRTKYAHLSKINVKKGQKIVKGKMIGRVGNTGRSTGAHLHYEIIVNGKHKNPEYVRVPGSGSSKLSGKIITKESKRLARKYIPKL